MNEPYVQQYVLIGCLTLAAIVMAVLPLVLARFIAPKKPGASKNAAYECGLESTGDSWMQFRVQYYVYALLFVIFDVEVVFIFPWALIWKSLGAIAFIEMAVFLGILGVGLAYAWKKGVLEWD